MDTVNDMMRILRSKLQENNKAKITDEELLDSLNTAKDECFNLVARRYPDAIGAVVDIEVSTVDGTFKMPEDAFEQRLTRVYRVQSSYSAPLERVEYRKLDEWIGQSGVPTHYTVVADTGYIVPIPSIGSYTYRAAYVRDLPKLVQEQGQIVDFQDAATAGGNATITIVDQGSRITNSLSSRDRFVNLIDATTGLVKATLEIKTIDESGVVTFKATPTRARVYNRTVSSDLPEDLELDDYLCTADGSCVLFFKKPNSNYILQYATTEIKRSLGMDAQLEETALRRFEKDIDKLKSRRESSIRVYRMRDKPIGRR